MPRRAKREYITQHKQDQTFQIKIPTNDRTPAGRTQYRYARAKTLEDAIRTRDALIAQVRDGTLPEPHQMTVADLLKQYLEHRKGRVKTSTVDSYTYEANRYVIPHVGNVKLANLKPLQIEAMQTTVASQNGSRAAQAAKATLSRALRQAVRWQLLPRNPAEDIESVRHEKEEFQVWEPSEVHTYLEHVRTHENPWYASQYPMFYLELSTGLRIGELLALAWTDVQASGSKPALTVRRTMTRDGGKTVLGTSVKTGRSRRLSLSPDQLELLETHRTAQDVLKTEMGNQWHDGNLIFPTRIGTPWNPSNMTARIWHPLSRPEDADGNPLRVGWPPIRFHDLRHTYASLAIRAKMDSLLLADRLGHRDPAFTLRVYGHVFDQYRQSGAISMKDLLKLEEAKNPDADGGQGQSGDDEP